MLLSVCHPQKEHLTNPLRRPRERV